MPSPFEFQGPLLPAEVRGRDTLLAQLARQVTDRRVTALLGPRRYGKTSVLRRLAHDLSEVSTVWLDLYGVQSLVDVVARLDASLAAAPEPFATRAARVAAKVEVTLGLVRVEFARPRRNQPDASVRLAQLLEVLVGAARSQPTLLVIDEFSDIGRVRGAAELLRTSLQHHYRDLGLLLAGSHVSAMRQLFTIREQPFYGQAELVQIGPLGAATVHAIVEDGFAATGRRPGGVAASIHRLAVGHPQRTMLLADAAWSATTEGATADEVWPAALEDVRRRLDATMRTLHDSLTVSEQRVLRLLSHDEPLFGSAARQLGLTAGAGQSAIKQLLGSGHVDIDDRHVVDPLLADWFRRTLPL